MNLKGLNRYLVAFSFLILGSSFAVTAQTVKRDSTYRPGNYAGQVVGFNAEPTQKGDFVFLGNSITQGTDWAKLLNLPQAKNRGISGDITFGVLERLQEIIDGKPAKIFILIGINDISIGIPDDVILSNYKRIISRIRVGSKKTQIYFYTVLPVNSSSEKFLKLYDKEKHIVYLNDHIRKFRGKKLKVIDLNAAFSDKDNHLRAELTYDGLHLLPAGYQVWKTVLEKGGYLK